MTTEQSEDINELAAALAKVQAGMRPAAKDAKNPHLKTMYADLTSIVTALQPELGNNGLAILQTTESDSVGTIYLATTLAHSSGQWLRGRLRVEVQPAKGLNIAQSLGLALTYCRRYSIAAMVMVCTEDDDGNGAGSPPEAPRGTTQQAKPHPPQEEQKPAPPEGVPYFRYLAKCQQLKKAIGEDAYYSVLKSFGLEKSNQADGGNVQQMRDVVDALMEKESIGAPV